MRSEAVYSTPIVRNYDQTNHYSTIGTAQPTQSPVHFFQVHPVFYKRFLTVKLQRDYSYDTSYDDHTYSTIAWRAIPTCTHVNMQINQILLSDIFESDFSQLII